MSLKQPEFLPVSRLEAEKLGWKNIDILFVSGDAYVDHPSFGPAVIGRVLVDAGYRVGMISQPDWTDPECLKVFGRPLIASAVSSGNLDSMLNIYTAGRRKRKNDAYSPGGRTGLRPPHALTVYSQMVKRSFPGLPVILGGIEASLRRIAHYDYWQDRIRPSVLLDSKADILVHGMGEETVLEVLSKLDACKGGIPDLSGIRGTARLLGKKDSEIFKPGTSYVELPSYAELPENRRALMESTIITERESNPYCARGLYQVYGDRTLLVEPPREPLSCAGLDRIHELHFSRRPHPVYTEKIPAFETVKDSVPALRGCPGGCSFCSLVLHQGHILRSRSEKSILSEIKRMSAAGDFKGTVSDIGGVAGNIYGHGVHDFEKCRRCRRVSCLFPAICPNYNADEKPLMELLRKAGALEGVKNVFINSGIRLDLAVRQKNLMREIVRKHVSGHMKVAPEHLDASVLKLMRKNPASDFFSFVEFFEQESRSAGKEQYLVPLFISNFPGCTEKEMKLVDDYLQSRGWSLQQAQDFIPLPMTMGTAMYYCGQTPDGKPIPVNRGLRERRSQLKMLKRRRDFRSRGKSGRGKRKKKGME